MWLIFCIFVHFRKFWKNIKNLFKLTHNQVVPGSSPGGPTENQKVTTLKVVAFFVYKNAFSFLYFSMVSGS